MFILVELYADDFDYLRLKGKEDLDGLDDIICVKLIYDFFIFAYCIHV